MVETRLENYHAYNTIRAPYTNEEIHSFKSHTNPKSKEFMPLIKFPLLTIFLWLCEYLKKIRIHRLLNPSPTQNETPLFVMIEIREQKIRGHYQHLCFMNWSLHLSQLGYYCGCGCGCGPKS